MNDDIYWIKFFSLLAIFLLLFITNLSCFYYSKNKLIAESKNPIETACALDMSNYSNAFCIALIKK